MRSFQDEFSESLFAWCTSVIGPFTWVADTTREHPGKRALVQRLQTSSGVAYLKIHQDPMHWSSEVHAYEQWTCAFGGFAPRLFAVHDLPPLALLISEIAGNPMQQAGLTNAQQRVVWRSAGEALCAFHHGAQGTYFGPCQRDGTPVDAPIADAQTYLVREMDDWIERGLRVGCLGDAELGMLRAAGGLLPAFVDERPVPCHRDYCPANWLVDVSGAWAGVIDFEFSYWDVRAADFARTPDWEWLHQPDLFEAFMEGYGRNFSAAERIQQDFARVMYALGAMVWGAENEYRGFAEEGRQALHHKALFW